MRPFGSLRIASIIAIVFLSFGKFIVPKYFIIFTTLQNERLYLSDWNLINTLAIIFTDSLMLSRLAYLLFFGNYVRTTLVNVYSCVCIPFEYQSISKHLLIFEAI